MEEDKLQPTKSLCIITVSSSANQGRSPSWAKGKPEFVGIGGIMLKINSAKFALSV
jgi:hypothetical protein